MKINRLITSVLLGSVAITLHAQDAAPASVDLFSPQNQPQASPASSAEPTAPELPELSQLDETFKQRSLGRQADEHRLHIEWRQLKNQVVNDPAVREVEAATRRARTDLEKRQLLRNYYNIYYERMSALAQSAEMKLALQSFKLTHLGATNQPRVRHSTDAALPGATPSPTPEQNHREHQKP